MYSLSEQQIRDVVDGRQVGIAVIGLGRVGLPLAAVLAREGFEVVGVDIKSGVVDRLNTGRSPYPDEIGLDELMQRIVASTKFRATTQIEVVKKCDLIVISVPTLIKGEEPDITAVRTVADSLSENISPGKVVLLQSTVPPFTTQEVLGKKIEERTGLKAGRDFGLAYSPERTQAPQVLRDLESYPKVVGGIDEKSVFIVSSIYGTFAPSIIKMESLVAAELEKLIENTYRDVNIAFANELARICELYGADVQEIIKVANSQPHSHILNPGLVGGHCIPMDPYYVCSDAGKRGYRSLLLETARQVNESMVGHITGMVDGNGTRVAILGLSFKPDVRAFEHSHSTKVIEALQNKGCRVVVHDPFLVDEEFRFEVESDVYKAISGADCVILSTAHSEYQGLDFGRVKALMRGNMIIDVRGFFDPQQVRANELKYRGIGR